jgi:beta-glucosidase
MDLPANQVSLINKVLEVNSNVVLVNSSGAPINLSPFVNKVGAIIQSWFLGGACGKAVIDVLFGSVNPSGKLCETWPLNYHHVPTSRNFPETKEEAVYKEGLYTGYRYYDSFKIPVLFPFGYGLSYTNFEYSNLKLSNNRISNSDLLTVSVDITNTGKVKGQEVVQLYIKDVECYYEVCEKYLKDFVKVT